MPTKVIIPAKAGIFVLPVRIPAFAGMTLDDIMWQ
jgi:hypothetical protein